MPTISVFYGIMIRMFYNDHPPPHFHARYGEFEATVDIGSLEISRANCHSGRFCRENTAPAKIEPLA